MRTLSSSKILIGLCLVGGIAAIVYLTSEAIAQTPLLAEFAIPDTDGDGTINIATGPDGDVMIVTGTASETAGGGGCIGVPGTYPIQDIVIPGGGPHSTRFANCIRIDNMAPLRNGTRIGNLTIISSCQSDDGTVYIKVRGEY
jgi:hypothetical protein